MLLLNAEVKAWSSLDADHRLLILSRVSTCFQHSQLSAQSATACSTVSADCQHTVIDLACQTRFKRQMRERKSFW